MKHTFKTTPNGNVQHYIDDELRATVPAKNKEEYFEAIGHKPEPAEKK